MGSRAVARTGSPSVARVREGSITSLICYFLADAGNKGATIKEIYDAVHATHSKSPRDSSIRATLYRRLKNAKGNYFPLFDRVTTRGLHRYFLIKGL